MINVRFSHFYDGIRAAILMPKGNNSRNTSRSSNRSWSASSNNTIGASAASGTTSATATGTTAATTRTTTAKSETSPSETTAAVANSIGAEDGEWRAEDRDALPLMRHT